MIVEARMASSSIQDEDDYYGDGLVFYAGSRLLAPFSRMTGWNIDKVRYLLSQEPIPIEKSHNFQ